MRTMEESYNNMLNTTRLDSTAPHPLYPDEENECLDLEDARNQDENCNYHSASEGHTSKFEGIDSHGGDDLHKYLNEKIEGENSVIKGG